MARRSQCSSAGDNPLDPNYLPPHYREEYRLAIDALVEKNLDGYYEFLQKADVVNFLSPSEIQYIQNSVRTPNQSNQPEQYFLESEGEGSSDTYWPVHSDLEVPGLDLGWPQMHTFIEPTEITTLVNPPEPDMPSIKEQARRLIKNAQQVIAIVMDIFTDVDMFADILNAASRRVAVYILLDEHNADHFINMVVNCRVNLQNFQFLRVRTVSGITYQCRSGKSLKGQMMDRFLLTDCRAVLSGNYSFMWSFEKLHRCMAHLFLGQLVTNFDEEFRILFAQSQPLIIENLLVPVEDFNVLQKTQYPTESSLMYREPRKFLSPDSGHSEEWARHSIDERMDGDYRKMTLKRHDSLFGPGDMYSRFASQQPCIEPHFDQGPARILMTENPAFKRHSYAEGVHSRYSFPFLPQQGMLDSEPKGKPLYRGQQHYQGPEVDYSGYDKFWNQDFPSGDQHLEPSLPQEVPQLDNFDPVLNYLSSTRNLNFDQSLEKSLPASHPKRLNVAQPYVCQTSPTPSNSADQKQFYQHPATDRKDPTVKRGMRNWRISSYLSAYENPEEDLFLEPSQLPDTFEEPTNPKQQSTPGMGVLIPKMPNVKEFKVPATPRASQMPSYAKAATQVRTKKLQEEPVPVAVEIKVTPTPSESSSTNEGEKTEDAEQKEPKNIGLRREDSFRRKYNATMQRNSRLKSSLIYSTLENQQTSQDTTTADQHDEEIDTNKTEQTKLPFVSHVLGQKKTTAREPFEWSCYTKSPTETCRSDDVSSKGNCKDSLKEDNSKHLSENPEGKETLKQLEVKQDAPSPSVPQTKPFKVELPKIDQLSQSTKSLLARSLYEDMSDPDQRLMFFKELAAKRKVAEASKAEKEKAKMKPDSKTTPTIQKEESPPKIISDGIKSFKFEGLSVEIPSAEISGRMVSTEACEPTYLHDSKNTKEKEFVVSDSNTSDTCSEQEMKAGSEIIKFNTQPVTSLAGSAETEHSQIKSLEESSVPHLFKKDYLLPSISQSRTSELALPKTDQLVQPAKPFIRKPLYMDMSDPDKRFLFFKDLAAKRKAAKAEEAEKEQIKSKVELKNSLTSQKNEPLTKLTSDGIKTSSNIFLNPAAENVEKMMTMEACKSASSLLDDRENKSTKDSVVNNDSRTGSEQENKFSVSGKTELFLIKSPEEPTVSDPVVEDSSHFPNHKNDIPADALSVVQVTDERASLTLESTAEFASVTPSPVEWAMTPALHTNTQNPESVQLETRFYSPFPSEPDTGSEISSSSDHPLPISGSQNSPSITEEPPPDLSPEDSSSTPTPNKSSQNYNEAKVQELISTPSQASSQSAHETLQESDTLSSQTHLDSVPQSGSSECTSAAKTTNLESNISFERNIAGPEPNVIYSPTNHEEFSAVTLSTEELEKDVSELEKGECVEENCEAPESSEDIKADCTSPMTGPSVSESDPNASDLESFVSKHDFKDTVNPATSPDTQSTQMALKTESIKNTDFIPITSPTGNAMASPNIPSQTTLSTKPNLTDFDSPVETEVCASLTESDQSVLPPETKTTDTILFVISSETQSKAEGSLVHQSAQSLSSSPEFTSETPEETDLPCKICETEKASESQISASTVPEERSEKELEFVNTDEKISDNSEDKSKSENICTLEYVAGEAANDQINRNTCSESTEVASKQPKSGQSRYSSSTANVLSSSNLRDDTKLLLEQISVNHQSRNEAAKELSVTDDEKEDKAEKKERGFRKFIGREPKLPQEREKLLERIQSMRKEKKIYSRFEMAS